MIRVARDGIAVPQVLLDAAGIGKTELEAAEASLVKWRQDGKPVEKWTFEFKAYRKAEVKQALEGLFAGKCAYCETRYAATQPMDVEHWRPKGQVEQSGGKPLKPGYYWLAADWHNLLPSCIDCNRRRHQIDAVTGEKRSLGKKDQFPLAKGSPRARRQGEEHDEKPLLLHPCDDDPNEFFEFTAEGVIKPRDGLSAPNRERAVASIRVFALNRSILVLNRRETLRLLELHIYLVKSIHRLLAEKSLSQPMRILVDEMLARELQALARMCRPDRPYSLMARQIVAREMVEYEDELAEAEEAGVGEVG